MKAAFISLLILPILLAGCTTPLKHTTPSGRVEVTINGTSKAKVKEKLVNEMINKNYTVTKSDDTLVVFERPIQNAMAAVLFASRFNSQPNVRSSFNLIQNNKSVRVVADFAAITNPGSGFEQRTDLNSHPETAQMQNLLDQIKSELEHRK